MTYPADFLTWPTEKKNIYFATGAKAWREKKAAAALLKITTTEEGNRSAEYSDDALATIFSDKHSAHLRYVAKWGKWLSWDDKKWSIDDTLKVYDLVRKLCRYVAKACPDARSKKAIASAKTISAVEILSRSDRRTSATAEQWDSDPFLLNTPGGIVDVDFH
jgi:putative DNA primase/helicase